MSSAAVWRASLVIGLSLSLPACSHRGPIEGEAPSDQAINAYPTNYKADILAAMHAYLNDPTGIRDAAIAEPVLKPTGSGGVPRYIVCLKFNPKKSGHEYAGSKEVAAVFLAGRFDQFNETPRELCAGAAYAPFPELQKLPP